jgi:hypothetical protein
VKAERAKITTPEVIQRVRHAVGDVAFVICWLTVAELAHGEPPNEERVGQGMGAERKTTCFRRF